VGAIRARRSGARSNQTESTAAPCVCRRLQSSGRSHAQHLREVVCVFVEAELNRCDRLKALRECVVLPKFTRDVCELN
jgi:hypothetical protein